MSGQSQDVPAAAARALRRVRVIELGQAVREVLVAVAATEVDVDVLADASAAARSISAQLSAVQRPLKQVATTDDLAASERFFSPVSGQGNPMSPPLVFEHSGSPADGSGSVRATTSLDRRFEGPPGFVHGGITALLFDEALGYAVKNAGRWGMTAALTVSYRTALPLDVPFTISAHVVGIDGRKTHAEASICLASAPSVAVANCTALFIQPRDDTYEKYFGALVDDSGAGIVGKLNSKV